MKPTSPRPGVKKTTPKASDSAGSADPDAAVRGLRQFRQGFSAVKTHFQQVGKRAGLGGAQVWALSAIAEQPGMGVSELAQAMDIHQSTASNLVKVLVQGELVATDRNGPDRRTVQLRLLPAGSAILKKAPGPFSGVLPQALEQMDAASLRRLERDLARLIDLLDADSRAAKIPLAHM